MFQLAKFQSLLGKMHGAHLKCAKQRKRFLNSFVEISSKYNKTTVRGGKKKLESP